MVAAAASAAWRSCLPGSSGRVVGGQAPVHNPGLLATPRGVPLSRAPRQLSIIKSSRSSGRVRALSDEEGSSEGVSVQVSEKAVEETTEAASAQAEAAKQETLGEVLRKRRVQDPTKEKAILPELNPYVIGRNTRAVFDDAWSKISKLGSSQSFMSSADFLDDANELEAPQVTSQCSPTRAACFESRAASAHAATCAHVSLCSGAKLLPHWRLFCCCRLLHAPNAFLQAAPSLTDAPITLPLRPQAAYTTVMVVGASGRVGRVVVRKLLLRGYTVKVLSRNPSLTTNYPESVEVIEGDVGDFSSVRQAVKGVDKVRGPSLRLLAPPPEQQPRLMYLHPSSHFKSSEPQRRVLPQSGHLLRCGSIHLHARPDEGGVRWREQLCQGPAGPVQHEGHLGRQVQVLPRQGHRR